MEEIRYDFIYLQHETFKMSMFGNLFENKLLMK